MNIVTEREIKEWYKEFIKTHPDITENFVLSINNDRTVSILDDVPDQEALDELRSDLKSELRDELGDEIRDELEADGYTDLSLEQPGQLKGFCDECEYKMRCFEYELLGNEKK